MNFYEELFKVLSNDEDTNIEETCLITNEKLEDFHVTLMCGHKFNYLPLFHEICNQKYNNNNYEIQRLGYSQIKCPYCRNIQNFLLPPPYKDNDIKLVKYVNTPIKLCMKSYKCPYILKNGKNKGNTCNKECFYKFCNKHDKINDKKVIDDTNIDNNKTQHTCCAILSSGFRKGQLCNKIAKYTDKNGSYHCGIHIGKENKNIILK
jgi:hypothetical protein